MTMRTLIVLVLALAAAASAAVLAQGWLSAERSALMAAAKPAPAAEAVPSTFVLVAAKDLKSGGFVLPDHLRWQPWPEKNLASVYAVKGERKPEEFVGAVVRHTITAGQPVTDGGIVRPGDRGFLAAVLTPGMRAVTVPVTATSGLAGLVFPGDRVDLIMTVKQQLRNADNFADTRFLSHTVLRNIRVLAVDQKTENTSGEAAVAKTATLEVDPKQAEAIALALEMGRLSLSLRSLARDMDSAEKPVLIRDSYTLDSELLQLPAQRPPRLKAAGRSVVILRGGKPQTARRAGGAQ